MTRKAAPGRPCSDGQPHHWIVTEGRDEQGRPGSHERCQRCGAERFWPSPSLDRAKRWRAYGRLSPPAEKLPF